MSSTDDKALNCEFLLEHEIAVERVQQMVDLKGSLLLGTGMQRDH